MSFSIYCVVRCDTCGLEKRTPPIVDRYDSVVATVPTQWTEFKITEHHSESAPIVRHVCESCVHDYRSRLVNLDHVTSTLAEALGCYDAAVAEWDEAPRLNRTMVFCVPNGNDRHDTRGHGVGSARTFSMDPGTVGGRVCTAESVLRAQRHEIGATREMYEGQGWWHRFGSRRWVDDRQGWSEGKVSVNEWIAAMRKHLRPEDNAGRLGRLFGSVTPVVELLCAVSANVSEVCGEHMASFVPRRGTVGEHLLRWWLRHPQDTRSHRDVMVEYLIGFKRDRGRKPEDRLPSFSSDPIYPFLIRYCKKLGRATSGADWILRQTAREIVLP